MGTFTKLGMATGAALLLVVAGSTTGRAAYDKAELKCRTAIAKNFTKAIQTGQKTIAGCHKGRAKDGGATDCNVLNAGNADSKGKFSKAKAKITDGIQKACIDAGVDGDVLLNYVSCPEPCTTDIPLANPMTTYAQLGQCLACLAGELAEQFGAATQGLPAGVPLSSDDGKCHGAVGKSYGKYLATILKERTKCQGSAEKAGTAMDLAGSGCATADPKNKISGSLTKAGEGVDKLCGSATLANLDSCDDTSLAALKGCLQTETESSGASSVTYTYEMPPTICPVAIDARVNAANSINVGSTSTKLEIGWTGLAHEGDLQDGYQLSVDITCPNSAPPCGDCTIDGASASGSQSAYFLRCANDFTQVCDEPFAADLDDCGGNQCMYVLGPPLPLSTGNNPTCSINRLLVDFTGTSNPDDGTGDLTFVLSTVVNLGTGLTQPCPVCQNDPTPLDGVRGGTCSGGANNGGSCDIQGFSASFAAQSDNRGLSLDCPPEQLANISGSGLIIPIELTTGSTSLAFENACDAPLGALDCACGQCSGNTLIPCRNDQECNDLAIGTCTAIGSGVNRVPNDCSDGECVDIGGGHGECNTGPDDKFCDGLLDGNGNGFLGCSVDGDCDSISFLCPNNNCGTCSNQRRRACYLDPIVATGTPDVDNPTLVSTFCLPPTNNAAINGVTGTPGAVRLTIDQTTKRRY
jgi:hypothetical protein